MKFYKADAKLKKSRKWRLIVRNASFSSTEDDIRKSFDGFGQISEIVMPLKKNHFAGFCFVQFVRYPDAVKAMKEMNGKMINDRTVAVDWAVPKDQYMTAVVEEKQKTAKPSEIEQIRNIKEEEENDDEKNETIVKKEKSDTDDDSSCSEEENSDSDEDDDKSDEKVDANKDTERKSRPDPAVEEGRTLFVRRIPFDVEEEKFREVFSRYGEIKYALICKYPNTDHSKGSGFVQFLNKSNADACLDAALTDNRLENGLDPSPSEPACGVFIDNQRVVVCRAVAKGQAKKLEEKHDKNPKDKRNLHLLRVGLIREGTKDAENMSKADGAKRTRIEMANRQKIKNLHIFVSPTRLCVHNLPTTKFTDKQLKKLCLQSVDDKNAKITECRIMRDLKRLNTSGIGKSRGYAFIEFVEHEHAYKCLKHLNNNASIFTDEKRPIVEFSLENRVALNAKQRRLEASRANSNKDITKENEKSSVVSEAKRKKSSSKKTVNYKPTIVSPLDGAAKLKSTNNPFPSHIGPKIRHRKRTTTTKDVVVGEEKRPKQQRKQKQQRDKLDSKAGSTTNNVRKNKTYTTTTTNVAGIANDKKKNNSNNKKRTTTAEEDTFIGNHDEYYRKRFKKQRWFDG